MAKTAILFSSLKLRELADDQFQKVYNSNSSEVHSLLRRPVMASLRQCIFAGTNEELSAIFLNDIQITGQHW